MKKWLAVALLFSITACETGEFRVPMPIGGGDAAPVREPVQPVQPDLPGTAASKMLQDPDAQKQEWTEDLWAANQTTAENRCQEIANRESQKGNPTVQLGKPTQVYQNPSKYGDYLFRCRFQTEVVNSYADDHQQR